jgi:stress-induced morphogen
MTPQHYQNKTQKLIQLLLVQRFAPKRLVVHNDSHLHAGHKSAQENPKKGHFRIEITDPDQDLRLLQKHRAIYHALRHLMDRIHALQIILT